MSATELASASAQAARLGGIVTWCLQRARFGPCGLRFRVQRVFVCREADVCASDLGIYVDGAKGLWWPPASPAPGCVSGCTGLGDMSWG